MIAASRFPANITYPKPDLSCQAGMVWRRSFSADIWTARSGTRHEVVLLQGRIGCGWVTVRDACTIKKSLQVVAEIDRRNGSGISKSF